MGTLSKSLRRPLLRSTTAVVDAESWGEYVTVACQIAAPKQWHAVSRSFAFAASNRREDVITGKPEASNNFLIKRKTIYDRLKKQKQTNNRNCKTKKAKSRILHSRSSDYATRQVLTL